MADPTIKDLAYRGLASVLGGPVDLATMVMRPFGYNVPEQQVVGGSEWIGKKLEDVGLVSSARAPLQEFITSMAIPTPSGLAKGAALGGAALVGAVKSGGKVADAISTPVEKTINMTLQKPSKIIAWTPKKNESFDVDEIISPFRNKEEFSRMIPEQLSKTQGMFFPDVAGSAQLYPTKNGDFLASFTPSWGSSMKPFNARGNDAQELINYVTSRAEKQAKLKSAASKRQFEKTLPGKLQKETGQEFTEFSSARSESKYLIHEPTGIKIRISGHDLPGHYEPSDLDLPNWIGLEDQANFIKQFLQAKEKEDFDSILSLQNKIKQLKNE